MALINSLSGIDIARFGIASLSLVAEGTALIKSKFSDVLPGIDGFVFDYKISENVTHAAQITDHFCENNTAIQDHVAIEPVKITLVGKVAELVFRTNAALAFAQATADRLTPLGVFTPVQALHAQQFISKSYAALSAVDAALKLTNSMASLFSMEPAKNAQQKAFTGFENLFYARQLFTVETPWRTYDDMIIENWTADQEEASIMETTFSLTFKQIRKIGTTVNVGQLQGRLKQQAAGTLNKGTAGAGSTKLSDWTGIGEVAK